MSNRTIADIARDISREWKNVYFGAVPYLQAMRMGDYGIDGEASVVIYFLANAQYFRGPRARELKNELRVRVGQAPK